MELALSNPYALGIVASLLFQVLKPTGWNRWVKLLIGVGMAAWLGNMFSDPQTTAIVALAAHGAALNGTPLGNALEWNILGRLANAIKTVLPSNGNS